MNVGDYVRDHIYGIGKIIKCYDNELEIVFKKSRIKTSVSSYFEFNLNKSSPQIIDLIEKNDYVNGYLVIEEPYTYHDVTFISVDTQDSWGWGKGEMPIENIKTIVTHEQMEDMQYRVEE